MNFQTIILQLGQGMLVTVEIFFLTLLFSLPLGLLVAFGRMSKNVLLKGISKIYISIMRLTPLRGFIKAYISIMRGPPLMLQLIVVYFGPYYLFGTNLKGYRFPAIIIAFAVNYAAYFAEIYRGGIESMPVGQYEAAEILGYGKVQTFFKIIFPQVMKRILPSITNETITLVKDTSLAFVLSQAEMFTLAKQIAAAETSIMPLMAAGLFYYIFNLLVAAIMERIEKSMDYYH